MPKQLNLYPINHDEVLGSGIDPVGSLFLREVSELSRLKNKYQNVATLNLIENLQQGYELANETGITDDVCYLLLEDALDRSWIDKETSEDLYEIYRRFQQYLINKPFKYNDLEVITNTLRAGIQEILYIIKSRTGEQRTLEDLTMAEYKQWQELIKEESDAENIGQAAHAHEFIADHINDLMAVVNSGEFKMDNFINDMLKLDAFRHTGYNVQNAYKMPIVLCTNLIKIAKERINIENMAIAKLTANLLAINGAENVKVENQLVFDRMPSDSATGVDKVIESLDGIIDDSLYIFILGFYGLI